MQDFPSLAVANALYSIMIQITASDSIHVFGLILHHLNVFIVYIYSCSRMCAQHKISILISSLRPPRLSSSTHAFNFYAKRDRATECLLNAMPDFVSILIL